MHTNTLTFFFVPKAQIWQVCAVGRIKRMRAAECATNTTDQWNFRCASQKNDVERGNLRCETPQISLNLPKTVYSHLCSQQIFFDKSR